MERGRGLSGGCYCKSGLSLQLLVGCIAVAAPKGIVVVATLGPFDPEDVDGGHTVRVRLERRVTE